MLSTKNNTRQPRLAKKSSPGKNALLPDAGPQQSYPQITQKIADTRERTDGAHISCQAKHQSSKQTEKQSHLRVRNASI